MTRFVLKRLLLLPVLLFLFSVAVFAIVQAPPGDFLTTYVATLASSGRSEEHTSELQSRGHLVCRLLLEKKQRIRR